MNPLDPSPSFIHTTPHLLHGEWDEEAQHFFSNISDTPSGVFTLSKQL